MVVYPFNAIYWCFLRSRYVLFSAFGEKCVFAISPISQNRGTVIHIPEADDIGRADHKILHRFGIFKELE